MATVGLWTGAEKSTKTARPSIAINQKMTSAEFNALTALFNNNAQCLIDLKTAFDNSSTVLPYVRVDSDFTITNAGIYVCFGSVARTLTINDAIEGSVEIRTIATADFALSGNINSNHLGTIYQGTAVTFLRWDSVDLEYNF